LLNDFFGTAHVTLQQVAKKRRKVIKKPSLGRDLQAHLSLAFREGVLGCTKLVEINRCRLCSLCKGSGQDKTNALAGACSFCSGQGTITQTTTSSDGKRMTIQTMCHTCKGTGSLVVHCKNCSGSGKGYSKDSLLVEIPPGVKSGHKRVFKGEGDVGDLGCAVGDLIVVVNVEENSVYRREGDDVFTDVWVSYPQAVLGDTIHISFLYGQMDITIPPGTQPGDALKISNQGFLNHETGKKGDMYIKLLIKVPKILSPKELELLRQLADLEKEKNQQCPT